MANRIILLNGCSMSNPSVFPKNWLTGGRSTINIDWRIQYYFYDPSHPRKKKLCVVKNMNEFKDLAERREITKAILENIVYENKIGYHPILKKYVVDESFQDGELHKNLYFIDAFRLAATKLSGSKNHIYQVKSVINRIEKSARSLKLLDIPISELKRSEMKKLLEACKFPNNYYNKARSYLSALFSELIEYECCEVNLIRDIRKRKIVKMERETLSVEDYKAVMSYLKANYYPFWRYAKIFGYSGGRSSELFELQAKNIDIENQEYRVLVKKGKHQKEVTKVILKEAIPYWNEVLDLADSEDYIFSKGLVPGPKKILANQITKRWYRLVKKSDKILDKKGNVLKVTADFYSLKHSFLDSLPAEVAQQMAAHTNAATTAIYQVNKERRQREVLKKLDLKNVKV